MGGRFVHYPTSFLPRCCISFLTHKKQHYLNMDFEDIYETDENIVSPSGPNVPPPLPGFFL